MFRVTSRQNQEFSCNQRPGRGRGVNVCVCVCVCLKRGKIQATKRFTSDWLRRCRHHLSTNHGAEPKYFCATPDTRMKIALHATKTSRVSSSYSPRTDARSG